MKKSISLLSFAIAMAIFANSGYAISIDMVDVGNPGNPTDARLCCGGLGSVGYDYQIGKYEITAGQYTEFLNAVADDDTYNLYNTQMWSSEFGAKIQRSGTPGSYSYSVADDWANRPVNFVSAWNAARFANWLHNDQPTGPQGPGTTEDGAYINIGDEAMFSRQPGAKYWIPTRDEWHKAAYYDPNYGGNGVGGYLTYPTWADAEPGRDITELTNPANNANWYGDFYSGGYVVGSPYYRTEVGQFALSQSPYGTFDQAGNVTELIMQEDGLGDVYLVGLGGSFADYWSSTMDAYNHTFVWGDPGLADYPFGFRIAGLAVPEPATGSLCVILGSLLLGLRRFKQTKH